MHDPLEFVIPKRRRPRSLTPWLVAALAGHALWWLWRRDAPIAWLLFDGLWWVAFVWLLRDRVRALRDVR